MNYLLWHRKWDEERVQGQQEEETGNHGYTTWTAAGWLEEKKKKKCERVCVKRRLFNLDARHDVSFCCTRLSHCPLLGSRCKQSLLRCLLTEEGGQDRVFSGLHVKHTAPEETLVVQDQGVWRIGDGFHRRGNLKREQEQSTVRDGREGRKWGRQNLLTVCMSDP